MMTPCSAKLPTAVGDEPNATSATARTPAWPTCPPPTSPSTTPGCTWSSSPSTFSPGCGCCASTVSSPKPNRAGCDTPCSTPRELSSAPGGEQPYASPLVGPGRTSSSPPSPGCPTVLSPPERSHPRSPIHTDTLLKRVPTANRPA